MEGNNGQGSFFSIGDGTGQLRVTISAITTEAQGNYALGGVASTLPITMGTLDNNAHVAGYSWGPNFTQGCFDGVATDTGPGVDLFRDAPFSAAGFGSRDAGGVPVSSYFDFFAYFDRQVRFEGP